MDQQAARRREIDAVLVWKLDRWGRSLHDLFQSLKELSDLDVFSISVTESIDLSTSIGRALAGMLTVFANFERELLRERVKAGIAYARSRGKRHCRPRSVTNTPARLYNYFNKVYLKQKLLECFQLVEPQFDGFCR